MASTGRTQIPAPWHWRPMTLRTAASPSVKLLASFAGRTPDIAVRRWRSIEACLSGDRGARLEAQATPLAPFAGGRPLALPERLSTGLERHAYWGQ